MLSTTTKDYTLKHLVKRLVRAKILQNVTPEGGKQTIHSWIRHGWLELRKRPHNNYYVVNKSEMERIVIAFSPGGSGHWSYQRRFKLHANPVNKV